MSIPPTTRQDSSNFTETPPYRVISFENISEIKLKEAELTSDESQQAKNNWQKGVKLAIEVSKKESTIDIENSNRIDRITSALKSKQLTKVNLLKIPEVPAHILSDSYWLEKLDKHHRYGKVLRIHRMAWEQIDWTKRKTKRNFFDWLEKRLNPPREKKDFSKQLQEETQIYEKIWKVSKSSSPFHKWMSSIQKISEVEYFNETQREKYRVHFKNGRLYYSNNTPVNNERNHGLIFAWSHDSHLYVGPYERGRKHHSSFVAGEPIQAAGELFCRDGQLFLITDMCGHYYSPHPMKNLKQTWLFLVFLEKNGIDLNHVNLWLNTHTESKYKLMRWRAKAYKDLELPRLNDWQLPSGYHYLGKENKKKAIKHLEENKSKINHVIRDVKKKETKNPEDHYETIFFKDGKIHSQYISVSDLDNAQLQELSAASEN